MFWWGGKKDVSKLFRFKAEARRPNRPTWLRERRNRAKKTGRTRVATQYFSLKVSFFYTYPSIAQEKKLQVWGEGRAADLLDFLTKWLNTRRRALISPAALKSQKWAGSIAYSPRDWTRRPSFYEKRRAAAIFQSPQPLRKCLFCVMKSVRQAVT